MHSVDEKVVSKVVFLADYLVVAMAVGWGINSAALMAGEKVETKVVEKVEM